MLHHEGRQHARGDAVDGQRLRGFGLFLADGFALVRILDDHRGLVRVCGKVGLVAQVAPAAHHGQVDAGAPAFHGHGQHVNIARLPADLLHRLALKHGRQRRDLVAHRRRLLELQPLGVLFHLALQAFQHLGLAALQEARRIGDVARVVLFADGVDARTGAAMDLVQ
ncbi:hypothetical protein D3C72_1510310 [compost metagenome]